MVVGTTARQRCYLCIWAHSRPVVRAWARFVAASFASHRYADDMEEAFSGAPGSTRPDSRIFQANERTLLAWLRTGLALVTFGFVLARIDAWLHGIALPDTAIHESPATAWIGAGFVALGLLANGLAIVRFVRTQRALRTGAALPPDAFPVAFAGFSTLLGVMLAAYLIARLA
jgi:putative membrane protein